MQIDEKVSRFWLSSAVCSISIKTNTIQKVLNQNSPSTFKINQIDLVINRRLRQQQQQQQQI